MAISIIFHLSLATWVGTVIFINSIIIPILKTLPVPERGAFIQTIFSRAFHFATVVAIMTCLSSIARLTMMDGTPSPMLVVGTTLIGGLTVFHLLVVWRLLPKIQSLRAHPNEHAILSIHRILQIIPRIGLMVLLSGATLMVYG